MPFQKGKSGNPNGRPRRGNTMTDALKRVLREQDEDGVSYKEKVVRALVDAALAGNMAAVKEINERLDGKVEQKEEITGHGGRPIQHQHSGTLTAETLAEAANILEKIGQNGHSNGSSESNS